MEELSEELKDNQYYFELLDALVVEHDMELKNRLQIADRYTEFIQEQSTVLMNNTIKLVQEREVSFLNASSEVIEEWKAKNFQ